MEPATRRLTRNAFDHFERLVNPAKTYFITSHHIDHYVAKRRQDRGLRPGSLVSVATINKELRHLRADFGIAKDWGYMPAVPRIRRHKSYLTTQRYINMTRQMDAAVAGLHVPEFLRKTQG
jgi:hypothetical protein